MATDLSIEFPKDVCFVTTRTIASRLWFIHSPELEERILAHLAKYQDMYSVEIYGFILMGNHYHLLARFPKSNRYKFIKAFNAIVAKLTARYVESFIDGKLWARRARVQVVPTKKDIERQFIYLVLNPVSSGLIPYLEDHIGYQCFNDTVDGFSKYFKLVNWSNFNNRKRHNSRLKPNDCAEEYRIKYSRLPGFERLSKAEYRSTFISKISEHRKKIVQERTLLGQGFAGKEVLRRTRIGAIPRKTKTSERHTPRPLVLTDCIKTKNEFLTFYFSVVVEFKKASRAFQAGQLDIKFPPGTHRPPLFSRAS